MKKRIGLLIVHGIILVGAGILLVGDALRARLRPGMWVA